MAPLGKSTTQLRTPASPATAGGAPSGQLPRATVNLQSTTPMSTPQAPTLRTGVVVDDEFGEEPGVTPFAIITIILTVVLLAVELLHFVAE